MTLDEEIKYAEEVAELNEECARIYNEQGEVIASCSCKECAEEHRQLAEWLRELKAYRDARVGCEYCKHNYREQHERPCSLCKRNFMDMFEREVNADDKR